MTMWALWAMTECEPYTIQILYHRKGAAEITAKIKELGLRGAIDWMRAED